MRPRMFVKRSNREKGVKKRDEDGYRLEFPGRDLCRSLASEV